MSPKTAPLVIEAVRLLARLQVDQSASFNMGRWDFQEQHVEEIVASASLILIDGAAFEAAREQYPGSHLDCPQVGASVPDVHSVYQHFPCPFCREHLHR